ncbi:1,4-alpha-glucan branching enzyme [Leptolyngbya sp. PCC 7375]|nr:1,4-alpha-glucan branching enzyme [Leptolyngbya sp. PCC 7375]
MAEMYMSERFGAWQVGNDPSQGAAEFKLFFPNRSKDASQYEDKGGTYGDPQITSIQVVGDFQAQLGQSPWDIGQAPQMQKAAHSKGWVWSYRTPTNLQAGFYEYKYYLTFNNGETRYVGDPCTRYGGSENQNSAFVIGGSAPTNNQVSPLAHGRKHLRDLIVYELMIDDFTDEYRGARAPLEAVRDKLDYLQTDLGINAILFMPWTAWPSQSFSWGYIPHQYFSVEYRYANALNAPAEKLSWLKRLINECHQRDIHVIMDGVFNHVGDVHPQTNAQGKIIANGFPYRWLYQDYKDSPYAGVFGGTFPGLLDLDYHNGCTQEFIRDVCFYWIDSFGIDGIRFDNTTNFYIKNETKGLPQLLTDIRNHVNDPNFSLTLEHLNLEASQITNDTVADSYWNNELYQRTFDYLWHGNIDSRIVNALNTHSGLNADKVATTYIDNHDHSHVAWQAGARNNAGALEWYRTQPYAIALFTCPGSPMIQNGQEFAEDYWLMEDDKGSNRRVKPRPLRWDFLRDSIGSQLFSNTYQKLISIRKAHAGLRSNHIYPDTWETWQTQFNPQGYGVDVNKGVVIYHRWGNADDGALERFIIAINFSGDHQVVNIPFPANGSWEDLLNQQTVTVQNWWLLNQTVNSHWGRIFYKKS